MGAHTTAPVADEHAKATEKTTSDSDSEQIDENGNAKEGLKRSTKDLENNDSGLPDDAEWVFRKRW